MVRELTIREKEELRYECKRGVPLNYTLRVKFPRGDLAVSKAGKLRATGLGISRERDLPLVLRYLDIRERTCREALPALDSLTSQLTRSRTTLRHVNSRADAILRELRASFDAGKMRTSSRLAEDLLTLSSCEEDPRRHRIPAYRYLSLIHVALGRHDRASSSAAALVRLSLSTNDVALLTRALVTLGKVHLSFGHLRAAARAWESVSVHVDHPIPRAWLHHEIGRCHLETGKYAEALRKAAQCQEYAAEAGSNKWIFHGGLLRAQCLAMLGRFAGDDSISQSVALKFFPKSAAARRIPNETSFLGGRERYAAVKFARTVDFCRGGEKILVTNFAVYNSTYSPRGEKTSAIHIEMV